MKIEDLSNADLAHALRCCNQNENLCPKCPAFYIEGHCTAKVALEAANRLDNIVSITAQRDAMAKQLKLMGVTLDE